MTYFLTASVPRGARETAAHLLCCGMRRGPDLTGQTFSRWTVVERMPPGTGKSTYACRCECGAERQVAACSLTRGLSRSCGCLGHEEASARLTVHGKTGHPLFAIWKGMLTRCRNPNTKSWKRYGGRGIKVCDRWADDFQAFYDDMAPTWSAGLTIERNDNDGHYEPSNCRWIPRAEQARNREWCTYIDTPNGRLTIAEAARAFGISFFALRRRIRCGWPEDQWLRPPAPGGRKKRNG